MSVHGNLQEYILKVQPIGFQQNMQIKYGCQAIDFVKIEKFD